MPIHVLQSNTSASAVGGKSSQEISYCPFMADGAAAHPLAYLLVTHLCSPRKLLLGKSCCAFQLKQTLAAAQEFCMNFDCAFTPEYSEFQQNCAGVIEGRTASASYLLSNGFLNEDVGLCILQTIPCRSNNPSMYSLHTMN